jgi:hypothetical protein
MGAAAAGAEAAGAAAAGGKNKKGAGKAAPSDLAALKRLAAEGFYHQLGVMTGADAARHLDAGRAKLASGRTNRLAVDLAALLRDDDDTANAFRGIMAYVVYKTHLQYEPHMVAAFTDMLPVGAVKPGGGAAAIWEEDELMAIVNGMTAGDGDGEARALAAFARLSLPDCVTNLMFRAGYDFTAALKLLDEHCASGSRLPMMRLLTAVTREEVDARIADRDRPVALKVLGGVWYVLKAPLLAMLGIAAFVAFVIYMLPPRDATPMHRRYEGAH